MRVSNTSLRIPSVRTVRSPEAPFFQALHGGAFSYDGLRSWLRRITDRAGVPRAHLHLCRHTATVDTLEAGADVRTVQLKLGHASITTTQRYLNMASRQLSEWQKEFSPIDQLKQQQAKRAPSKSSLPLWRRAGSSEDSGE